MYFLSLREINFPLLCPWGDGDRWQTPEPIMLMISTKNWNVVRMCKDLWRHCYRKDKGFINVFQTNVYEFRSGIRTLIVKTDEIRVKIIVIRINACNSSVYRKFWSLLTRKFCRSKKYRTVIQPICEFYRKNSYPRELCVVVGQLKTNYIC